MLHLAWSYIGASCRRGKEYETFRCADLYPLVYGMQYMDKRGCSYQQFKDEADLMRCARIIAMTQSPGSPFTLPILNPNQVQVLLSSF